MARIGCKVLLRNICFTKELPVLLVNKQLYYHPVMMICDENGIVNEITIGNRTIITNIYYDGYTVEISEDSHFLTLDVNKLLDPACLLNYGYGTVRIYKDWRFTDTLRKTLREMLSTDIFRICIPMFEFFKANSN